MSKSISPLPKLSVIILSWNSKTHLERGLPYLRAALARLDHETIIIDNGSQDGTLSLLEAEYPDARVHCNEQNVGVAKGRNQGLERATGEYALFMDADTVVLDEMGLQRMVGYMDALPGVGVLGPKLVLADGSLQYSCRRWPTPATTILRSLNSFAWANRTRAVTYHEMRDWNHSTVREVDYVIGACQLVRRSALVEIGGFDDRMFTGPDDVDMCLRMRLSGQGVVYYPHVTIVHHTQNESRRRPFSRLAWLHARALVVFYLKHWRHIGRLCTRAQRSAQVSLNSRR